MLKDTNNFKLPEDTFCCSLLEIHRAN